MSVELHPELSTVWIDWPEATERGQGFVVGRERWIVTASSVVEPARLAHPWGAAFVTVTFASGRHRRARVIRASSEAGLALLEMVGGRAPAPPLDLSSTATDGVPPEARIHVCGGCSSQTGADGQVLGMDGQSVQVGVPLGPSVPPPRRPPLCGVGLLDGTTAGAPAVDASGQVIGLCATNMFGTECYAAPVRDVRAFVERMHALHTAGASQREAPGLEDLGITGEDVPSGGVRVLHIDRGSPAHRACLIGTEHLPCEPGGGRLEGVRDIITALGDRPTPTVADLIAALARSPRGRWLRVTRRGRDETRLMLDPVP